MNQPEDKLSIVDFYTSTPAKTKSPPRCLDLFDSDDSGCSTPKRTARINLNDCSSNESWRFGSPIRPVRIDLDDSASTNKRSEWPVRIDLDDSASTNTTSEWPVRIDLQDSASTNTGSDLHNTTCIDLNETNTSRESWSSSEWNDEMPENEESTPSISGLTNTVTQHSDDQGMFSLFLYFLYFGIQNFILWQFDRTSKEYCLPSSF